ncbi:mechanosensitive ion channel [Thermovibrio ammonificans]|uniref:Conserved TM helix repeat-containing protein n=1 Tax=Thermovibrio ammonificans (strain DSM 15698 / JCM 12110 / HB-1) TaxID=648996 RepID=E8T4W1_THEA1|nr:mechanosensitive ion channel [Thermovibrio ammonificans]ADU96373.1 Conserved TM helix repeat-containing protein [Thermovibrio ammonificans HB-1]
MGLSLNALLPYVVVAVKAVVIFVVGWIFAAVAKSITYKICNSIETIKKHEGLPKSTSSLVYYFILLITVVAVLEVLGLKYVTQPFLDLLNKVAAYIPNIIGAVVILFVGVFFAKVAKEFVNSLLETFQIEELGKKYGIEDLGGAVGNLVYLFILLFVVIAALNALQIQAITAPAVAMLSAILEAIPRIVAAVLVFGIIFYVGRIVADVAAKVVDELNIDEIAKDIGISSDKLKFDDLVRYLILTFAVLLGLSQAFHYLEAEALYEITYRFTVIAFRIVVASVILFVGAYIGSLIEKRVESETIGKFAKVAFIVAAFFIALPYVGVSPIVIEIVVFSLCFGVGLAFALAFGLGGKDVAAKILEDLMKKREDNQGK